MAEILSSIVGVLFSMGGVLFAALKAFKFVQEGQRGAMLRFGKFTRTVPPGFVVMIPWVNELKRVHVRQTTRNLAEQTVTLKDKMSFLVSAVILYRIDNVYKALFEISNRDDAINDLGMSVVREVVSSKKYEEATKLDEINKELVVKLREQAEQWGLEVIAFRITDFAPTPETSHVLLQEEAARAQARGNKILLESVKSQANILADNDHALAPGIVAALLMRNAGGVPVVETGK